MEAASLVRQYALKLQSEAAMCLCGMPVSPSNNPQKSLQWPSKKLKSEEPATLYLPSTPGAG